MNVKVPPAGASAADSSFTAITGRSSSTIVPTAPLLGYAGTATASVTDNSSSQNFSSGSTSVSSQVCTEIVSIVAG